MLGRKTETKLSLVLAVALVTILMTFVAPTDSQAGCGGVGERACCNGLAEFSDVGTACDDGLFQFGDCDELLGGSNCHCHDDANSIKADGVCGSKTACGGKNQRACCLFEGLPCDAGLNEDGNCANELGAENCGGCSIGVCRAKPKAGEDCDPVFRPCEDPLLCMATDFVDGLIDYTCLPELTSIVSAEECNTFRNDPLLAQAVQDGVTLNFGYGTSAAAGATGSIESGTVYGRDGCYGCYHTQCEGLETDIGVGAFAAVGISSVVDLICTDGDSDCFTFDGEGCATVVSAGIPVTDILGVSSSISFANCPNCGLDVTDECEVVGTGTALSAGIGLAPVTIGASICTTVMTVAGCLDADGNFVEELNEPPTCDVVGPYEAECNGSNPSTLVVSGSTDPNGPELDHDWSSSGCAGASFSDSTSTGPTFSAGSMSGCPTVCDISLTVDDGLETDTCGTTVTFTDTTDPTISCPADKTLECSASVDTGTSANGTAFGSDTCTSLPSIFQLDQTTPSCGDTRTIKRNFSAVDGCNNSASCTQTIDVVDTTNPSIDTAASDKTVECDGSGNVADLNVWLASNGGAAASDTCSTISWSDDYSAPTATCGGTGTATVNFTATDECGLSSTSTATFATVDTTDPVITCPTSTIYRQSAVGQCSLDVAINVTATDTCSATSIVCINQDRASVNPTQDSFPVGTTTVTCLATDACGESASCSFDVVVNDPPTITSITPATQTVQYGDTIDPVVVTATDCGPAEFLTLESANVPSWLSLPSTATSCARNASNLVECTFTAANNDRALGPQGLYTIDSIKAVDPIQLDGVVLKSSPAQTIDVTVAKENAVIALRSDNDVAIQFFDDLTPNHTPFTLFAEVRERGPSDSPVDTVVKSGQGPLPGDIANAVVAMTLQPIGPGSPVAGVCGSGTVAPGSPAMDYANVLTVGCTFSNVPVNTYEVSASVVGNYYVGGPDTDVFTVFDPSLGFTTGGGWFQWPGTGERTNFGFTMKYNKRRTSIQGNFLMVRHLPNDTKYRVKSNAVEGLAIGSESDFNWASFNGKSTYQDPSMSDAMGNHSFVVYVEDHAEPGKDADRFWVEVFDKKGYRIGASSINYDPQTHAETIVGGNIVVPHQTGKKSERK